MSSSRDPDGQIAPVRFAVPAVVLLTVLAWLTNRSRPNLGVLSGASLELGLFVFAGLAIGSVGIGTVVANRVRGNPIGWLLIATGLLHGLTGVLHGHAYLVLIAGWPLPGGTVANWVAAWLIVPTGILAAFVILLFPDGRLPSPRWRWPVRAFVTVGAVYGLAGAADAWSRRAQPILDLVEVAPAIGEGVIARWWPTFMLLNVLPIAAVVARYRGGQPDERAQIRWLATAFAIVAVGQALLAIDDPPVALVLVAAVGTLAVPVAIAVAILHYRLYAIDRIISRTVTYGLVVAVLAGVYTAGVVVLGSGLSAVAGVEDSDLVVAASTLAAVALFRPLRSRVHAAVDRNFNRTGHRARQAVDGFPDRIRDEVDPEAIRRAVVLTAVEAVQPARASIWLADASTAAPDREDRP
jgi:hypothetical protein